MLQNIDLQQEGFDNYGRHILAPGNKKIPITYKDVFQGERVIYTQGNIQPRSVNKFNVTLDVLATKFDLVLSNVKQIATGYTWTQNNYIFVVTWDGTNYYLRRYNTIDYAVPVQDGYSVNIPTVNNIYGVGVLYNRVIVIGRDSGGNKAFYYDFALNYQSSETKSGPTNPITNTFTTDGVSLYYLDKANNVLRKYDGTNYTLSASYSWPTSIIPTPDRLLCYDGKSFWAFDTTDKRMVRFLLENGSITILFYYLLPEDVVGVLNLRGTIYHSYIQGQLLTSIPMVL